VAAAEHVYRLHRNRKHITGAACDFCNVCGVPGRVAGGGVGGCVFWGGSDYVGDVFAVFFVYDCWAFVAGEVGEE